MRGSLKSTIGDRACGGIIPAHAGLTLGCHLLILLGRDHPRACGAHILDSSLARREMGSSPRMRGSLVILDIAATVWGIIPAHAGLTTSAAPMPDGSRDHPRACGAHRPLRPASVSMKGSSPRMRGSRDKKWYNAHRTGIIPAHAGLTSRNKGCINCSRDHPRACGAHTKKSQY